MKKDKEKKAVKKLSKKMKSLFFLAAAILILIGASIYTVLIRPRLQEEKVSYEPTSVNRGTVRVTVNESGAIEYSQSSIMYELNLDVSDDDDDEDEEEETVTKYLTIEEVYKAAGEIVYEGDELLKFTDESIDGVRTLLASAVADAQVDYNDAKSSYELDCLSAELDYKTQLITAGYATKLYKDASSKVNDNIASIQAEINYRQGRISKLEEAITEAQEDFDEANEKYTNIKNQIKEMDSNQYESYLSAQTNYLNAQTSYNNALTALENAQDELNDNASQIKKLRTKLASAEASRAIDSISVKQEYEENVQSGDNAYLVYVAKLESLEEDLKEAEDKLNERLEQQEEFEKLVGEDGIVSASEEGMLVLVNVEAADKLKESQTMISYVTKDALTISVDVTEEDIVSLKIGQPVDIVFTAYPDESFEGVIQSIETTATSSNTNTVSYPVVIKLDGILDRMYGGMTAKVSFEIESSDNALYISRKALIEDNGSYYVYVKSGLNEYELKKVTIGLKNTTNVEITSGLSENDTIYILTTGA